ncbi:MAG: hypothetical protein AAF655_13280 [Bacteroidota bacterium]
MRRISLIALLVGILIGACNNKSPEDLPKYKKKFRTQIASFEDQKVKANERVEDGVELLNGLQAALENAKNTDKEFARVYGKWNNVDKQVNTLFKEYEALKQDAENLFNALDRQTSGLNNVSTRGTLQQALTTARNDYEKTLARTEEAINNLRSLHDEAIDVVKALEVAYGIGQIAEINDGLISIENRVNVIMEELTSSINESKALYETKIGNI